MENLMLSDNHRAQRLTKRRHDQGRFRPQGERLEAKVLLTIDLGGTSSPSNPQIANIPYGMDFGSAVAGQTAGTSVSDVGDLLNNGYEDLAIGAPGNSTGLPGGAVYVVLGSQYVKSSNQSVFNNWIGTANGAFLYGQNDRVGDLGMLGLNSQTNPVSGAKLTYPFSGVTLYSSTSGTSANFGASVAGVKLSSGNYALIIGAPGADGGNGRVYVVFGNFGSFSEVGPINVDNPPSGLTVVTYVNNASSTGVAGALGSAVAGGFNILGDSNGDIIMGAPAAGIGSNENTGVIYVLSTSALPGSNTTVDVNTLNTSGQSSSFVVLAGANAGEKAGFSVADCGDVNGVTSGSNHVDDLLIGSPNAGAGNGWAYLVYGGTNLPGLATPTPTPTGTVRSINLANVGGTGTGAVPGAIFVGPAGSQTGFAVASAGDYNDDGFGDILIGSPSFSSSSTLLNQGEATMFYGAESTSTAYLTGTITLGAPLTGITPVTLQGADAGDQAGYALSDVGVINSGQPNEILIGAPGYTSLGVANSGTAYLLPGQTNLAGTFTLGLTTQLFGVQFVLSTPNSPAGTSNHFGASVSGRLQTTTNTVDQDNVGGFILGAPGYDVTQNSTRAEAGGAMVVEGSLITVPSPPAARARQVAITSPALHLTAGSLGQVTIELEASNGKPAVSTSSQTIRLGTASAGGAFASPTRTTPLTSVVIPAGQTSASFFYSDTKAGAWTLTASDTALASTSTQQATVIPAPASLLVLHTQPSSTARAGVVFATQPVVYEEDPFGNLETGDNQTVVSASLATGAGPLQGTITATVSGGIATFKNLADNLAETVSLRFVSGSLNALSHPIVVTAAPATQLVVITQPPDPINPGEGFPVVVWAEDKFKNVDTNYNGVVSISLAGDPGLAAAVQAVDGVATFTGLTVGASLTGLAIQVAAPGLSGTTTNPVNVNPVPMIMLEKVVSIQKKNRKGKPVGKPIFSGFAIQYDTAMNPSTAGLASNYQVFSEVVKRVKKKTTTTFKPVNFSVTYSPMTDSVTVNLKNAIPFAKGGEITISGVTSQAGVLLDSSDADLSIQPKAKNITLH
jgi:hypothetical protein